MKLAAFNVENLFDRAKAFNQEDNAVGQAIIGNTAELNRLLEEEVYTPARKARMLVLLEELGLTRKDDGPFVWLRRIRGRFLKRPQGGGSVEVVASGRADWIGWIEHKTEQVNEIAIGNTGRVIRDVDADILAVIEAEDRVSLEKFVHYVLRKVGTELPAPPEPYVHVMVIDGNDERGIDVGLLTKRGFDIGLMRSHVDDPAPNGEPIFSRDCPEYSVQTPGGNLVWIIPNHFKSKFGGDDPKSRAKRKLQAASVAEIYTRLRDEGHDNIVVLGDLNDVPASAPLKPLLAETNLRDVSDHPSFNTGMFAGRGTFGLGNDNQKIDYLLLSPNLFSKVTSCGLFRKGAWPGKRPRPRWEVYPELEKEIHVASDHHVIWAEVELP